MKKKTLSTVVINPTKQKFRPELPHSRDSPNEGLVAANGIFANHTVFWSAESIIESGFCFRSSQIDWAAPFINRRVAPADRGCNVP